MPIYEFYCDTCHTVFSFFSKTVNTTKRPSCPRCGRPKLERQLSRFAISKGQRDDARMGSDDERIARALDELAAEHDSMDQDDPLHAVPMIRKMYEIADMPIPERGREIIRRLEAGEDPVRISEACGNLWGSEDSPFAEGAPLEGHFGKLMAPRVDETLHDL